VRMRCACVRAHHTCEAESCVCCVVCARAGHWTERRSWRSEQATVPPRRPPSARLPPGSVTLPLRDAGTGALALALASACECALCSVWCMTAQHREDTAGGLRVRCAVRCATAQRLRVWTAVCPESELPHQRLNPPPPVRSTAAPPPPPLARLTPAARPLARGVGRCMPT
jgi:hypothetical protein